MDFAGARRRGARRTARIAGLVRHARPGAAMRTLAADLAAAVRTRPRPPADVRELCRALCEEMSARRSGRPVQLRFERFPDEIEVTGLWVEFQDFDLVIVEERAEEMQQLVILGHELWHMHAGHRHRHLPGAAAARVLAEESGWREALTVAARHGSREAEEAAADDFGHRLATAFRPCLSGDGQGHGSTPDPVQRSMGYRGSGSGGGGAGATGNRGGSRGGRGRGGGPR
ncbi:toxin-antitoxin system, toxin component family protein [Streptomyces anandii]|uniref:Toxin-antitoxin system, toxin component family protein n=1 Tax=Streptomyces anandii TaxID=285454 RepID=A0ABW6H1I4_9ACTN